MKIAVVSDRATHEVIASIPLDENGKAVLRQDVELTMENQDNEEYVPVMNDSGMPVGFGETPPDEGMDMVADTWDLIRVPMAGGAGTSAHAYCCQDCQDHVPRTIAPPVTNGGTLRAMDDRALASWLAEMEANVMRRGPWTEEQYRAWLHEPSAAYTDRRT